MSNEGEWTTVTSKNSTSHKAQVPRPVSFASVAGTKFESRSTKANNNSPSNKKPAAKKDASSQETKSQKSTQDSGSAAATAGNRSRSSSFSSDSDSSQSDFPSSSGRPPYHAAIMIHCPFQSCTLTDPLTDSTSLVAHLKETHKVAFKNIHHMFILLDRYLTHWAEEIEAKGLEKVGIQEEGDDFFTIDPAVSTQDRTLRDEIQREKLNEILKIQEKERNEEAKLKRKCLFCKNVCDNR